MIFKNLEEKCEFYRSISDNRLMPNGYIIMMLDGRKFSKLIKDSFKRPFDDEFIEMMNETAKYLCENIAGAKFAYVQSDEISIMIRDNFETDPFFGGRQCKLLSIASGMAAGRFNQIMFEKICSKPNPQEVVIEQIKNQKLAEFDCKVWNVPNAVDAFAWFLYRQTDCIRNSKQQAAQTWFTHSELEGKNTDEQVQMLLEKHGVNWNDFKPEWKYGRIVKKVKRVVKVPEEYKKFKNINSEEFIERSSWEIEVMPYLTTSVEFDREKYKYELISIIDSKEEK